MFTNIPQLYVLKNQDQRHLSQANSFINQENRSGGYPFRNHPRMNLYLSTKLSQSISRITHALQSNHRQKVWNTLLYTNEIINSFPIFENIFTDETEELVSKTTFSKLDSRNNESNYNKSIMPFWGRPISESSPKHFKFRKINNNRINITTSSRNQEPPKSIKSITI